jgi:hypothetical protein
MSSESVEVREEKLPEGAKKIESSELSNQKEADILNSAKLSVHGCRTGETIDRVRVKQQSAKSPERNTRRLTVGGLSILVSKIKLIIMAWWSSSMIPS